MTAAKLFALAIILVLVLVSCGSTKQKPNSPKSFELSYSNDTINVIDHYGRRQGVWLIGFSKDTMVFLNDTGYSTKNSTAREVIRMLNKHKNVGIDTVKK